MGCLDPPKGGCWVALGQLLTGIDAGKSFECLTRRAGSGEWGVIKVSAMSWGRFLPEENKAVPPEKGVDVGAEVREGDLLLSRANPVELVGATVLVGSCRSKLLLSDKSLRLTVADGVNKAWLQKCLSSASVRHAISSVATGTSDSMRNISQQKLYGLRLPMPPAQEQDRMLLELEERESTIDVLPSWLSSSIGRGGRLRQSILKRAFEGKLVPQDPSDEPASVLLACVKREREAEATSKAEEEASR